MNPLDPILYFRPADQQHLQACVQAIAQQGQCVLLHSPSPGVLDHYGQSLVKVLRQRLPDTQTEIFFPAHSEALIARFNELLQALSVDDATQHASTEPPLKLWVVHDANALPEHELKLLVRLLQQFPGARLAAVLMLTEWPDWLRPIDPQGRRLHRWSAEPPSAEEAQAMVESARAQGREAQARELVARAIVPPPPPPAPVGRVSPPAPTLAPEWRANPDDRPLPAPPCAPRTSRSRTWAWALLLLVVSVGITAVLQPQATQALWQSLTAPAGPAGPNSPAAPASDAASAPVAAAQASAPAAQASAPAPAASEAASPAPVSSAPNSAASAPIGTSAMAAPNAPSTAPSGPSAAEPVLIELPDVALKGLAWVKNLPTDSSLVRHSRWPTAAQAQKQIGPGPLANARVLAHFPPGADKAEFWVVVGPFRSDERARNHIGKNGWTQAAVVSRSAAVERARTPSPSEKTR